MLPNYQPTYNPQAAGGGISIQGSAPNLQPAVNPGQATPGLAVQNVSNPYSITAGGTAASIRAALTPTPSTLTIPSSTPTVAPEIYAPKLDIASLNANARATAESNTNPYYTLQLNKFLAKQAQDKQNEQTQYDTNVQNLQDTLKDTLAGNAITGTRAGEDEATKLGDINTAADQFQTDSGQAFDAANRAGAVGTAQAGLTTSGIGAQAGEGALDAHNTTEARQVASEQEQRDQTATLANRTFADLARSGSLATTAEGKGETQQTFDLNKFIQGQANDLDTTKTSLEAERQSKVLANTQLAAKQAFNNYIASISNPAQRLAAVQTYGSLI